MLQLSSCQRSLPIPHILLFQITSPNEALQGTKQYSRERAGRIRTLVSTKHPRYMCYSLTKFTTYGGMFSSLRCPHPFIMSAKIKLSITPIPILHSTMPYHGIIPLLHWNIPKVISKGSHQVTTMSSTSLLQCVVLSAFMLTCAD